MINIPMNTRGPIDRNDLASPGNQRIGGAVNAQTISYIGLPLEEPTQPQSMQQPVMPQPQSQQQNPYMQQPNVQQPNVQQQNSYMQQTQPQQQNPYMQQAQPQQQNPYMQQSQVTQAYQTPVQSQPVNPAPVQTAPIQAAPVQTPAPAPIITKPIPSLINTVQKGQKVPLENNGKLLSVKACLGWNVTNPSCDVDVSAFLLGADGKVPGDDWFVFYGQETSPDGSTVFSVDNGADREIISIDLVKLNPAVSKIVFVLTINEALEKSLNFSMLKDAYVRIMDSSSNTELVSFKMTDYYNNVTSMMIGEMYLHNGAWKFNAIGNGVAKDLAGLCEMYGVQVI